MLIGSVTQSNKVYGNNMNLMRLSLHRLVFLFISCVFTLCVRASTDLVAIPTLTAPVMDTANMMNADARAQLNQHLLEFSEQHGSQIVVLTVPTIAPEEPFDYVTRVMDKWKLGRKGVGDGVLLLLVRDEHKTFLAPGRGLEGAIPDVYAKRILDDVLRPQLRAGNVNEGIYQTVSQLEKLINGEKLPAKQQPQRQSKGFMDQLPILLILIFIAGAFLKNIFGGFLGSSIVGFLVFNMGWYAGWNLFIDIIIAIMAFILTFIFAGSVFIGGGWGGGSTGGSGGGFMGGGGDYGGGGASGNW